MGTPVEAILKNGEQEIKDGRCPTCRQRNSLAGEREMDDGSVLAWYCNVRGCSNHQDHTNANALPDKRSEDRQQRVVGSSVSKGGEA